MSLPVGPDSRDALIISSDVLSLMVLCKSTNPYKAACETRRTTRMVESIPSVIKLWTGREESRSQLAPKEREGRKPVRVGIPSVNFYSLVIPPIEASMLVEKQRDH
jgi:hypothetical protein